MFLARCNGAPAARGLRGAGVSHACALCPITGAQAARPWLPRVWASAPGA